MAKQRAKHEYQQLRNTLLRREVKAISAFQWQNATLGATRLQGQLVSGVKLAGINLVTVAQATISSLAENSTAESSYYYVCNLPFFLLACELTLS